MHVCMCVHAYVCAYIYLLESVCACVNKELGKVCGLTTSKPDHNKHSRIPNKTKVLPLCSQRQQLQKYIVIKPSVTDLKKEPTKHVINNRKGRLVWLRTISLSPPNLFLSYLSLSPALSLLFLSSLSPPLSSIFIIYLSFSWT